MTCPTCAPLRARVRDLETENASLRAKLAGRPPKPAADERSRLIAAAAKATGLTRGDLAKQLSERIGHPIDPARLAPSGRFAAEDHERIMAELRAMAGEGAPAAKKRRARPPVGKTR